MCAIRQPVLRGPRTRARSIRANVDERRLFLHSLPLVGRFVRPQVTAVVSRTEVLRARELTETLLILGGAGRQGRLRQYVHLRDQPFRRGPRHDLDACSAGLVRPLTGGRRGVTYPDMPWSPTWRSSPRPGLPPAAGLLERGAVEDEPAAGDPAVSTVRHSALVTLLRDVRLTSPGIQTARGVRVAQFVDPPSTWRETHARVCPSWRAGPPQGQ